MWFEQLSSFVRVSLGSLPRFERKNIQRLVFAGGGLLFLGLFVKLSFDVFFDADDMRALQAGDEAVLKWMALHRSPRLTQAAVDLTSLGSTAVVSLFVAVFVVVFCLVKDWFAVFHLLIASISSGLSAMAFKAFFERSRPHVVAPLVEATGFSFPSGHTLAATSLYLTFAILAVRHFSQIRQRAALLSLAAAIALLIGFTRIYLGVHYPTDVASGMLLGAAVAMLTAGGTLELARRTSARSS